MARQTPAGRVPIRRRLQLLRNWELFNVTFFLVLLAWWIQATAPSTWFVTSFSVGLVCYLLLQGGVYWHIKGQSVAHGAARMPEYFCTLFTVLRRSSVVLLIGFPVIASIAWTLSLTTVREIAWSSALTGFAALEYVNYYHYQLMHDTENDVRF